MNHDAYPSEVEMPKMPAIRMSQNYVVGFLFVNRYKHLRQVVLIEKQKPDWQKGKWNGIGGKIEEGETPLDAMKREWKEETGDTIDHDWKEFLCLDGSHFDDGSRIFFFRAECVDTTAHTVTAEKVRLVPIFGLVEYDVIPNLRWIIPFAISGEVGHIFQ